MGGRDDQPRLFYGIDLLAAKPIASSPALEAASGIQKAASGAGAAWMKLAAQAIEAVARKQATLTSDDVWEFIASHGDPRAMGSALRAAKRASQIEPTSEYRPSERTQCHGRPVRVWRSLIFRG